MKKIIISIFILITTVTFASTSSTGATGTIDFPNAYTLRENNFSQKQIDRFVRSQ